MKDENKIWKYTFEEKLEETKRKNQDVVTSPSFHLPSFSFAFPADFLGAAPQLAALADDAASPSGPAIPTSWIPLRPCSFQNL